MQIENIKKAAETAKAKTSDKRWNAAINKAVAGVQNGWIVTELQNCIVVTTESGNTYRANDKHCQCRAFFQNQPCKHRSLYRLMQMAETAPAASVPMNSSEQKGDSRAEVITDIKSRWSSRFPGESLADELMRRFRRNKLEMLSMDFLTAIRAAI